MTRNHFSLVRRSGLAGTALGSVLLLAGCGGAADHQGSAAPRASRTPATAAATPTPATPTPATPTPTTPPPTATPSPTSSPSGSAAVPPSTPTSMPASALPTAGATAPLSRTLLRPAELPRFNGQVPPWRLAAADQPGSRSPGSLTFCSPGSFTEHGATQAILRTYRVPGARDLHAAELATRYPDAATRQRAERTWRSWMRSCGTSRAFDTGGTRAEVVFAYRHVAGADQPAQMQEVGWVGRGDTLVVVVYGLIGMDYDYQGDTPGMAALRKIASRL